MRVEDAGLAAIFSGHEVVVSLTRQEAEALIGELLELNDRRYIEQPTVLDRLAAEVDDLLLKKDGK